MTGNVLRRLREAYGFSLREVARTARIYPNAVRQAEATEKLWRSGHKRSLSRYEVLRKITAAMRALRDGVKPQAVEQEEAAEVSATPLAAKSLPSGTTHTFAGKPLRVVSLPGREMVFRHDGRDWVRSTFEVQELRGAVRV